MMEDPRWDELINRFMDSVNHDAPGKIKDIALAKLLWEMYARDQAYYYEIQVIDPTMHDSSALSGAFWALKADLNAVNHRLLDSIVASGGWPKVSQVGESGSQAACMIVQHMDLAYQEKYLPLIKNSCEQQECEWDSYAHVYDKVCCARNSPQRYGTQLQMDKATGKLIFYPIEDEANVNVRRAEVGLGTVEEYANMVGIMYNAPVKSKK